MSLQPNAATLPMTDESDEELMKCVLEVEKQCGGSQGLPAVADAASFPAAQGEQEALDKQCEIEEGLEIQSIFPFLGASSPCQKPPVIGWPRNVAAVPASDEEASSGSSKPAKSRRLNSKQPAPSIDDMDYPQALDGAPSPPDDETPGDFSKDEWWEKKSWREKYLYVANRIRRKEWYSSFQQMQRKKHKRSIQYPAKWSDMSHHNKQNFIEHWALLVGPEVPQKIRDWAKEFFLNPNGAGSPKQEKKRTRTKQLLLTYQGPFGEMSWQPNLEETKDMDEVVESCKKFPYISMLWDAALKKELPALVKRTSATNWAMCMEICPAKLAEGSLRIHLHVCLQRATDTLCIVDHEALNMFHVVPHMKGAAGSARSQGRRSCQLSAMYYCSAPKIGQIYWASNLAPYKDYGVNAEWTWNLLQQEKISHEDARLEFIKGKKNLTRHLANLDALRLELAAQEMEDDIRRKNVELAATQKKMKTIPAVSAWLSELSATRDRKKFLVLNGPSRLGKTQFAIGLYGREHTLEVNCASADHPPLRAFSPKHHKCVVFDEAPTSMVVSNKRLFQSPNCKVIIGLSPTNMNAYPVYLNDAALIICTNTWHHELAAMKDADAQWLRQNMVFVDVQAPLWEE